MNCLVCGDLKEPHKTSDLIKLLHSKCRTCNILATGLKLIMKGRDYDPWMWGTASFALEIFADSPLRVDIFPRDDRARYVEFYVPPGVKSPWPSIGPGIDLGETLSLDPSAEVIREWISLCEQQHQECHKTSRSELPTRLMEVGPVGADRIHLRTTTPESKGPYIALSYCWGNPEDNLKTTRGNIQSHQNEGILLSLIPKTIKDAISITRKLAISYIWVDALCIIQQDENDWKKEAGRMADVYGGAYLVIAATRSANANEGIFGLRKPTSKGGRAHPVPTSFSVEQFEADVDGNRVSRTVHVREELGHELVHEQPRSDPNAHPLLSRAWALQERILATRTVHFAAAEMVWECQEDHWCECKSGLGKNGKYQFSFNALRSAPNIGSTWQNLMTQYTNRSLTHLEDKLVALEGISHRFQELELGKYYYGIWESYFAYHMLWRTKNPRFGAVPIPEMHKGVVLGPSWSWVATHHPVYSTLNPYTFTPTLKVKLEGGPPQASGLQDAVLHMPSSQTSVAFFPAAWHLTLKAKVRHAFLEIESCTSDNCRYRLHIQPPPQRDREAAEAAEAAEAEEADFAPDFILCPKHATDDSLMAQSKQLKHGEAVICILLLDGVRKSPAEVREQKVWAALVVKPIENISGVYRRVGVASNAWLHTGTAGEVTRPLLGKNTWNVADEREITLV